MKKVNWLTFIFVFACFALFGVSYASLTGVFSHGKRPDPSVITGQWKGRNEFIQTCMAAESTTVRAKGDTVKAEKICSCLADKVEAKYPQGRSFAEATTEPAIKEIGAEFCYK